LSFFFVSCEEKDYYFVISAEQLRFACRSLQAQPPYARRRRNIENYKKFCGVDFA